MAIHPLNLPKDIPIGSDLSVSIPVESTDAFRQLKQVVIQIRNIAKTVDDQLVLEKTADTAKELVLTADSVETTATVSRAKYMDNRPAKYLKIDLQFAVADDYLLTVVLWGAQTQFYESAAVHVQDPVPPVQPTVNVVASTVTIGGGRSGEGAGGVQRVSLVETNREPTDDQNLWIYIRNGTIDFNKYRRFIDGVMNQNGQSSTIRFTGSPLFRTDAYAFLKQATDFYMTQYFSGVPDNQDTIDNTYQESKASPEEQLSEHRRTHLPGDLSVQRGTEMLPYFEQVLNRMTDVLPAKTALSAAAGQLVPSASQFMVPNLTLLELIWSYWHEEGGLVQTLNTISLRFQNVRTGNGHDPLAALNIDPLRPLSSLIWGYIQDERFRLSLAQRNFEYQYEYGLSLIGRAVPGRAVAESRSQFIPAFHNLLKATTDFYQQANYTTVIPDGFPILNHLREVHLLLAEGAHNSFRDLPYTARAEMLTQQWILARPEMREFLGGRIMVPYSEPWMDRVDTMKAMQGWDPANVTHFHDLGRFGEQLLLSIRYGNWNGPATGAINAANWAHYWREEIQRYVHAYKSVTGVDLTADITDARFSLSASSERYEQPAVLINRRVGMLPPGQERLGGMNQLSRDRVLREG